MKTAIPPSRSAAVALGPERDGVEDGVDGADGREVGVAREDLGRAERGDPVLVVVGGLGQHAEPRANRELGGEAADRAAGAGDEQRRARRRGDDVERLLGGQRVERQRRGGGVVDVRRERGEPAGVDGGGLRVGADAPADAPEGDHAQHAIAGGEAGRLAAHRGHLAGQVPARHERRLQVGHPLPRLAGADARGRSG